VGRKTKVKGRVGKKVLEAELIYVGWVGKKTISKIPLEILLKMG